MDFPDYADVQQKLRAGCGKSEAENKASEARCPDSGAPRLRVATFKGGPAMFEFVDEINQSIYEIK